jgi:nucleoside-diphosphate-sugar epimerase
MKILVTGASGFVGRNLVEHLVARGHEVTSVVRTVGVAPPGSLEILVDSIGPDTDWSAMLSGHDSVIHLAARVHVMNETSIDPLGDFRSVNVAGTINLARAAAEQGVKRFVFLSSIKVNGEATSGVPFTAGDEPRPVDPYGVSKYEAELALRGVQESTGLDVVIIRTPLVYGPGVGGNFVKTLWLAEKGIPVPLKTVRNARTMCSVWNLADMLERASVEPAARGALVLAADPSSPSTSRLIAAIARAMGKPSRIFPFPPAILRLAGRVLGVSAVVSRLTDSLEVESGSSSTGWKWTAPNTFEDSIRRTAKWYQASQRGSE